MKKLKHIGMRVIEDTLRKFQYIAKYHDRSINGQIVHLMNYCIWEFEKEHGKIEFSDGEAENTNS